VNVESVTHRVATGSAHDVEIAAPRFYWNNDFGKFEIDPQTARLELDILAKLESGELNRDCSVVRDYQAWVAEQMNGIKAAYLASADYVVKPLQAV
jgi:hypothetical protein